MAKRRKQRKDSPQLTLAEIEIYTHRGSPSYYIGIDPGVNGGIVALTPGGIYKTNMPDTEEGIWNWMSDYVGNITTYAVIEQVGGFMASNRGDDSEKYNMASAHTMFTFGKSYGALRMSLVGHGLIEGQTFHAVHPKKWIRVFGIPPRMKGEKQSEFKGRIKYEAQSLFPSEKVTNKTADAFLLATYCKLLHEGVITQ